MIIENRESVGIVPLSVEFSFTCNTCNNNVVSSDLIYADDATPSESYDLECSCGTKFNSSVHIDNVGFYIDVEQLPSNYRIDANVEEEE